MFKNATTAPEEVHAKAAPILFIALAARLVISDSGIGGPFEPIAVLNAQTLALPSLVGAAAIATLSFVGFDANSTLGKDVLRPESDIGFASVFVCLLPLVFCFFVSILATVVWPASRCTQPKPMEIS